MLLQQFGFRSDWQVYSVLSSIHTLRHFQRNTIQNLAPTLAYYWTFPYMYLNRLVRQERSQCKYLLIDKSTKFSLYS